MNRLEETFQRIMRDYGHDVLIVHNDKDEKCSCYEPLTGSVDRLCPYCFGTGHVAQIKKYRTRDIGARSPQSNTSLKKSESFGEMAIASKTYFFYKERDLREGDLIIEVGWDGIRPVYNDGPIQQISHIEPIRYLQGETVYYKVYVEDQPVNKTIRGIQVVKKAGEVQYQLAERKPHQITDPNPKQDQKDGLKKRG